MKIFLSYRFTGQDLKKLTDILKNICASLEEADHNSYCSFWYEDYFQKNKFSNKQILEHALSALDSSSIYLAYVDSEEKSEGMLIEAGYALAKDKVIYLVIKKGINTTFLRQLADKIVEFDSVDEMYKKIKQLKKLD